MGKGVGKMFATGQHIIQMFEQLAPKYLAIPEDKIGLQLGTLNKKVSKILLTLDVLESVVDEAIEKEIDLIISHHPIIYRPLKNLRTDMPQGRMYEKLIKNDISVYVAHTNLDSAIGGVNDTLVEKIGLEEVEILDVNYIQNYKKLVVYVPESHQEKVFEAISDNGAGWIGNYSHCSFKIKGVGTFKPLIDANPFIGEEGHINNVEEIRIETIIPEIKQNQIISAMLKVHPYEKVAYDIIPLEMEGDKYGLGRFGIIPEAKTLDEFAKMIKELLKLDGIRVVGNLDKIIKKVAIVGGDGNSYVNKSSFIGADVLITGDIYYHTAHEAMNNGCALIDVGHYVEKNVFGNVKSYLDKEIDKKKMNVDVMISEVNTNPFKFL